VEWAQLPVYVIAELLAGAVAGLLYVALSRTKADAEATSPATSEPASA